MGAVKYVENDNLAEVLGDGSHPTLVDFYAEWCGPCKAMAPAVDALATEMGNSLTVAKVDIDKNQKLAAKHNIGSVPTLMVFVGDQQAAMRVGALGKSELKAWVTKNLSR